MATGSGHLSLMPAAIFMTVAFTAMMTVITVALAFAVIMTTWLVVILVIVIRIAIIITATNRLVVTVFTVIAAITITTIAASDADAYTAMPTAVVPFSCGGGSGHHCGDRSGYNEDEFHFHNIAHSKFHACDRRDNA